MLKIVIGVVIGSVIGGLMGYYGKCTTGACPLTATPWRGGLYGAVMGALFASMLGGPAVEKVNQAVREAGARDVLHVVSVENFESAVLQAGTPALVDFYSDRCPPCRALAPTIDKLAYDYHGKALIAKVNVDKLPRLAERYGVSSIPTVMVMDKGKIVDRFVGLQNSRTYTSSLDGLVAARPPEVASDEQKPAVSDQQSNGGQAPEGSH